MRKCCLATPLNPLVWRFPWFQKFQSALMTTRRGPLPTLLAPSPIIRSRIWTNSYRGAKLGHEQNGQRSSVVGRLSRTLTVHLIQTRNNPLEIWQITLGVLILFIIVKYGWKAYVHPAHTLGRQAANMDWTADGREEDSGYKNVRYNDDYIVMRSHRRTYGYPISIITPAAHSPPCARSRMPPRPTPGA